MKHINIKAVAQLTGINANTLRAWERRYEILTPDRDKDGRRIYSGKDVEKISLLWSLVQEGHLIGTLAGLSHVKLKELNHQHKSKGLHISKEVKPKQYEHLNQIILALKSFDLIQVQTVLQHTRFDLSPRLIVTDLILPLLTQVGELVAESKLSISQEHLLSSLLRDYLGQIYQSLSPYDYKTKNKTQRVALTTREGDLHEFGILLAAILCRINNIETFYFGPNMPANDLVEACRNFKIDTIVLSFAKLPPSKEFISPEKYLQTLDEKLSSKVKILTGGGLSSNFVIKNKKRQVINFSSLMDLDNFLIAENRLV
ncbi:MAG: MerR family transcriptional regulator [Bdellovibrionaceae bacterium]|nr:MerR family transcriptional regulator [Pseudobdellovibrionaceae bacterium]